MENFNDSQNFTGYQELFHKVVQSLIFYFFTKSSIQQKILLVIIFGIIAIRKKMSFPVSFSTVQISVLSYDISLKSKVTVHPE